MLHDYTKKRERKPYKKPEPAIKVIQVAGPPFLWEGSPGYRMLRSAILGALEVTKQLRLDMGVDEVMSEKTDTTGLNIFRKEDLE